LQISDQPSRPPEAFLDVAAAIPALAGNGWRAATRRLLETILGIARSRRVFVEASREADPAEAVLEGFGLSLDAAGVVEAIPPYGGAIVVANHPFGGADALALIALCKRARPDFLVLANEMAAAAPGLGHWFLPLSILGDRHAARKNALTLKSALEHLRAGGLLAVFPAGEVSTWRNETGTITDGPWSPHITSLARKVGVPVLPVRFFGQNPAWFHLAGALHPLLRTALLPWALLSRRGQPVVCRAGKEIRISVDAPSDGKDSLREAVEAVPFP
jgi:putative hemolysin